MVTVLKYGSVGKVLLDLPGPLRIGDPIQLPRFTLRRVTKEGRHESLVVDGAHLSVRVSQVGIDATRTPPRQEITVEATESSGPQWVAVKKAPGGKRRLGSPRFPKTSI